MSILNYMPNQATISMPMETFELLIRKAMQDKQEQIIEILKSNFIDNELLELAISLIGSKTNG